MCGYLFRHWISSSNLDNATFMSAVEKSSTLGPNVNVKWRLRVYVACFCLCWGPKSQSTSPTFTHRWRQPTTTGRDVGFSVLQPRGGCGAEAERSTSDWKLGGSDPAPHWTPRCPWWLWVGVRQWSGHQGVNVHEWNQGCHAHSKKVVKTYIS